MSGLAKGWCPGALRPMPSGDGLLLRLRPHGGRLAPEMARAIAGLAQCYGNGLIDLGSRANLQLRGIRVAELPELHRQLRDLGLLDPDAETEARRNILTTPIWQDDETLALVSELETALRDAPDLPAKFGFAVDTGPVAVLSGASADIRLERAAEGLILRADGMARGIAVTRETAAVQAVALAAWFARHRGEATRMARLVAAGVLPPVTADIAPLTGPALSPGRHDIGFCVALAFGEMTAAQLAGLAAGPIRLTPWRSILIEGCDSPPDVAGLITDPDDPLLRVSACTGAPGCAEASVTTRPLARALAALIPAQAHLHVSGCAKGCARPRPSPLTLTGRAGRFDLAIDAPAGATPRYSALHPADIPDLIRGHLAP